MQDSAVEVRRRQIARPAATARASLTVIAICRGAKQTRLAIVFSGSDPRTRVFTVRTHVPYRMLARIKVGWDIVESM
jgi:hypothetical protein